MKPVNTNKDKNKRQRWHLKYKDMKAKDIKTSKVQRQRQNMKAEDIKTLKSLKVKDYES